jgi:hypothetical protein
MTRELREAVARVEAFLEEVPQPRPVRTSERVDDRTPLLVGGLGVHVMGVSDNDRARQIRASVRRIAPGLDSAIARLGPGVDQRPVYLIPFDKASYDLPAGGTTLAETRCYNQDTPVYGTPDDPAVPGRACVVVVFLDAIVDESELDFSIAHEWFHTIQHGTYPDADHTCRSAWWREGAADWFGHLVISTDTRAAAIRAFLGDVGRRSLLDFSYEAAVFHFWAANKFGDRWVFELGRRSDRELSSAASVSTLVSADDWRDWAESIADGRIVYPDGRPLPGFPVKSIIRNVAGDGSFTVTGPPLSVQLVTPSFREDGTYQIDYAPAGGLLSVGDDVPLLRPWARIAPGGEQRTVEANCGRPSAQLAAIAVGGARLAATVRHTSSGGGACDACYYGTWEEIVDRKHADIEIATPGQPIVITHTQPMPHEVTTRMQDGVIIRQQWQGFPVLTVSQDGSYTLDDPRVTTTSIGGQVLVASNDRTYRESGSWTARADGTVAVQRQRREIRGTQTVAGQTQPFTSERRLRGLPIRYVPFCSATELELWLPPMVQLRAEQERRSLEAGEEPAGPARVFRRR